MNLRRIMKLAKNKSQISVTPRKILFIGVFRISEPKIKAQPTC